LILWMNHLKKRLHKKSSDSCILKPRKNNKSEHKKILLK
jgi:hypothetical protein